MSERDTFGPRMRRERERRGISLETIATLTNVSIELWQGFERNDLSRWPKGRLRARLRARLRESRRPRSRRSRRRLLPALPARRPPGGAADPRAGQADRPRAGGGRRSARSSRAAWIAAATLTHGGTAAAAAAAPGSASSARSSTPSAGAPPARARHNAKAVSICSEYHPRHAMTLRDLRAASFHPLFSFHLLFCPRQRPRHTADARRLRVVSAGPTGEVASVEEANEIRVVFSEPMAATGAGPGPRSDRRYFHITPAVAGTFRWSGTTILIFTPARRLPRATKYDVTIDAGAAAVSGRKLAAPYAFSFTTPTARLLQTDVVSAGWPVRRGADHHPALQSAGQAGRGRCPTCARLPEPRLHRAASSRRRSGALARDRSVGGAGRSLRRSSGARRRRPPRTPSRSRLRRLGQETLQAFSRHGRAAGPDAGAARQLDAASTPMAACPRRRPRGFRAGAQSYTIKVEPTFFVDRVRPARRPAIPDNGNPIEFSGPVKAAAFAAALQATDLTDPRPRADAGRKRRRGSARAGSCDESNELSLEDAGFQAQPPASTLLLSLPADLKSSDGQTLGYTWAGARAQTWHQRAFTSFGDGNGVWEKGGGAAAAVLRAQLPARAAVGRAGRAGPADADADQSAEGELPPDATGAGGLTPPAGDAGSHPVARTGPVGRPESVGHRPGLGGGRRRQPDRAVARGAHAR